MNIETFGTANLVISLSSSEAKALFPRHSVNDNAHIICFLVYLAAAKSNIDLRRKKLLIKPFRTSDHLYLAVTISDNNILISVVPKNDDDTVSLLRELKHIPDIITADLYIIKNARKVILQVKKADPLITETLNRYGRNEIISSQKAMILAKASSVIIRDILLLLRT